MANYTAESAGLLIRDLLLGDLAMDGIDWPDLLTPAFAIVFAELGPYLDLYRAQLAANAQPVSFTVSDYSAVMTLAGPTSHILVTVSMTDGAVSWIHLNRLPESPTRWVDLLETTGAVAEELVGIASETAATTAERLATARAAAEYAGVALAASRNGETLYAASIGRAWLGAESAPTSETPFRAGSVTKPVTALTVLRLANAGLVDLDAPLSRYLTSVPLTPFEGTEPTVRQLLAHTGGLPRSGPMDGTVLRQLREVIGGGVTFTRPPGDLFEYSNAGFGLLGLLIEDVTGLGYLDAVRREVLTPEGMASSTVLGSIPSSPPAAAGYDVNGGFVLPTLEYFMAGFASGGLVTSTADLLRLGAAILAEPEMWAAMPSGTDAVYACGLRLQAAPDHPYAFHNGMVPGARGSLVVMPEDGVVVAGLANGGNDGLDALVLQTAALLVA